MTMVDDANLETDAGEESTEFRAGFVLLIGQPNVGKSTLMNTVLGRKLSITTSKPQTTRNRILGVKTWPGKGQICFLDTPGVHRSKKRLNRRIVDAALANVSEVDAICHLIDAPWSEGSIARGEGAQTGDEDLVLESIRAFDGPTVLALNKVDALKNKAALLPMIEAFTEAGDYEEIVPISALDGENIPTLVDVLLRALPPSPPLFPEDAITDSAERFLAAEFVREAVMDQTHQEIPYSVAVEIERFSDDPRRNLLDISAVIHVERKSQKGIVIGQRGSRIKAIGEQARASLERFFGKKVFLETFVRVEREWSESGKALQRFGYE